MTYPPITISAAKDVLRRAAWRDYGPLRDLRDGCESLRGKDVPAEIRDAAVLLEDYAAVHSRLMVHMRTGFGCDVELTYALERADEATAVHWSQGLFGTVLMFIGHDGRTWAIDELPASVLPAEVTV